MTRDRGKYVDSIGQPLNVSGGDRVTVAGWDDQFQIVSIRPEQVAVIRNLTIDAVGTSSIELIRLTRCRFEAEYHPHTGECGPPDPQALRQLADRVETRQCTGLTAFWCPIHGECACLDWKALSDPRCPLHAATSIHAEGVYGRD